MPSKRDAAHLAHQPTAIVGGQSHSRARGGGGSSSSTGRLEPPPWTRNRIQLPLPAGLPPRSLLLPLLASHAASSRRAQPSTRNRIQLPRLPRGLPRRTLLPLARSHAASSRPPPQQPPLPPPPPPDPDDWGMDMNMNPQQLGGNEEVWTHKILGTYASEWSMHTARRRRSPPDDDDNNNEDSGSDSTTAAAAYQCRNVMQHLQVLWDLRGNRERWLRKLAAILEPEAQRTFVFRLVRTWEGEGEEEDGVWVEVDREGGSAGERGRGRAVEERERETERVWEVLRTRGLVA
ncbi:hypothetical protein EPUS_00567 [Endocarpon pusillum Z07020]|uniref:Uncharacterized protein n=1 Tax=Endocarpon pusillum (strain Z07020 / HMAS-L-300199) TaxID=1263415 RepID=U1GHI1_ENDPU|nr:uncharacterized protein EPUS_00567 [Endocarpon pusillum Z07020]ERF71578.1 hypothetical protein EPUS_00567 [Endocarpon pusillum Z07020]